MNKSSTPEHAYLSFTCVSPAYAVVTATLSPKQSSDVSTKSMQTHNMAQWEGATYSACRARARTR